MPAARTIWKTIFIIPFLFALVLVLVISLRLTYMLQVFSLNTSANEPTIPAKQIVITSTLKDPKLFDFIAFNNNTQHGSAIWILRVCGMAGDSVEIRDGNLFVNSRPVDSLFTLSHSYLVAPKDTAGMLLDRDAVEPISPDSILITCSDDLIREKNIKYQRYIIPGELSDEQVHKIYNEPWNIDHFGPIKVPEGSFFVLGDNRNGAVDSRYTGFVTKKDYKGTALSY